MPISRIRVENFRSIKECDFCPTQFCALIGENNAGKSNVLHALRIVLGRDSVSVNSFTDSDFYNEDFTQDIKIQLDFSPPLQHQPFKGTPAIEVPRICFLVSHYKVNTKKANKGDRRFEVKCLDLEDELITVPSEAPKKGKQTPYKPLVGIPSDVREQIPLLYCSAHRRLRDQLPGTQYSLLGRLLEDIDSSLKHTPSQKDDPSSPSVAEVFQERLSHALDALKCDDFLNLEETIRSEALKNLGYDASERDRFSFNFELFDSITFLKAITLSFKEGDRVVDATSMGDGAQNALVMAIFQAYERSKKSGAIILVEEPEMYLHPHRRRLLYDVLRNISQTNQVIYTTHSPQFVAIPDYENIRMVYRCPQDTTKVLASTLPPSAAIRERLRKEFDPERNELFFAKHVILVEGDSEKLSFPEYASRLKIDLNRLGYSIIEVGGKRSLMGFVEILLSFCIPFTVVFDTDSSEFKKEQKEEEEELNRRLRSLADEKHGRFVVELSPKLEDAMRGEIGESEYQRLCQKHGGVSKAIRARLIAADEATPIPSFIRSVFASALPPDAETKEKANTEVCAAC